MPPPQPLEHWAFCYQEEQHYCKPAKLSGLGRLELSSMPRAPTRGCGALRGALISGPALVGARGPRPPLTSRHHEADVLNSQHRQLFLRVHTDDPVGEPVHGQDAAARGLVAVIRRPVRAAMNHEHMAAMSHGDGGSASWPRKAPASSQSCAYARGPAFSVLAYLWASGVCKSTFDERRHCSIPGTHPHMSPQMAVTTPSLCEATFSF